RPFIGSSDLPGNAARHLGGQMKTGTDLVIRALLQRDLIPHFALHKSVLTHKIEGVAIGTLDGAQLRTLFWCRMQFELCRNDRFHRSKAIMVSPSCQERNADEYAEGLQYPCPKQGTPIPPPLERRGILGRF